MARIDRPRGLIAFDSERNCLAHKKGRDSRPVRLIRPRTIVYVVILAVIATSFLATVSSRADLDINVLHDRNPLFVKLSDGSIRNGYTVKILNKARQLRRLDLSLEELAPATLQIVGLDQADAGTQSLEAPPDGVATYQVYVRLPASDAAAESQPLVFRLTDRESGDSARYESIFRGPGK